MQTELLPIEPDGVIAVNRIMAIASPDSKPIKRLVSKANEEGLLLDLTCGRKAGAVIFLDNGYIAAVVLEPGAVLSRLKEQRGA